MGHIQAHHIHPGLIELFERFKAGGSGTDGADYFGTASHGASLLIGSRYVIRQKALTTDLTCFNGIFLLSQWAGKNP